MDSFDLGHLKPEKEEVLNRIREHFLHNSMGYIKVPTGWGKTYLAKHLMGEYYADGKVVLFLVSRNNQLIDQTFYRDDEGSIPLFPDSLVLSSAHGKAGIDELRARIRDRKSGIVIFASLQTVLSKKNEELKHALIQTADLVVIDEIHNFIDNRGNEFIDEMAGNPKVKMLGMTATPFQGVVGNVKFVDDIAGNMEEVYNKTLPQCVMDGDLCELTYTIVRSEQRICDVFDFQRGLKELDRPELFMDCSTLDRIMQVTQRTYLAKRVYEDRIAGRNAKALVFCAPVRGVIHGFDDESKKVTAFHAKLCSAIFNGELKDRDRFESSMYSNYARTGQFKHAVYLSSELPKKEQNTILEAFRTIDTPPFVLCSVGMLIEGFDFPDLDNLILLRPTLSMRLFEQQVGRVTRLPKASDKSRGNIFEVADDVDSLYDVFGDSVFNGKALEHIQMLRPEDRIEQLFTEGETTEAIDTERIRVTEITGPRGVDIAEIGFGGIARDLKFQESSVQIPPTSMRTRCLCRLLSEVERKEMGKLAKEKSKLMRMALDFKVQKVEDAEEIAKLAVLLDRLEQKAREDPRLSNKCGRNKPLLFKEVKWLLKLRALTYLRHLNQDLDLHTRNTILDLLGFEGDYARVDEYRMECLRNGYGRELRRLVENIRALENWRRLPDIEKSRRFQRMKKENLYWASCFAVDRPEVKRLFESKEWNYMVKKYVIK